MPPGRVTKTKTKTSKATAKKKTNASTKATAKKAKKKTSTKATTKTAKTERAPSAKAKALHRKALRHNWDDGLAPLEAILADRACDLGTALAVYWMGAPGFDQQFATARDLGDDSWRRPTFTFLRRLEKRILRRDFATATILFNPRFDRTTIDRAGYDWTAEYADTQIVRSIPDALKAPSCADPAWEKRGKQRTANRANRLA